MTWFLMILTIVLTAIISGIIGFIFGMYMAIYHAPCDTELIVKPGGKCNLDLSTVPPQKMRNNASIYVKIKYDYSQEKEPL